ncbi:MAG TPA: C40 family peptidase [Bacteroidia bacterium]|nr:C40 family peptidase [Bacteroidia bacterium]
MGPFFLNKKIIFQPIVIIGLVTLFVFSSCGSSKKVIKKSNQQVETSENNTNQKIQEKYAIKLGVPQNDISNIALYRLIDKWYGVPYKFGGKTMAGIDCSDFVSVVFHDVYDKNISGTAASMYEQCKKISTKNLREGDLIFFKIGTKNISHIAIYLQNNKFVHATVHRGIMIDDLNESYYKKYYFACGRFK